jgi:hypothetical protein
MIHHQNMIIMSGGDLAVPLGLVAFYRFKGLSDEQAQEARGKWIDFKNSKWQKNVKLLSEYDHAYSIDYNEFLVIETPDFEAFAKFYPKFRDYARWHVSATKTLTGMRSDD